MAQEDEIIGVPRKELEYLRNRVNELTNLVLRLTEVEANAQSLVDAVDELPPGRIQDKALKAIKRLRKSLDRDEPRPGKGA